MNGLSKELKEQLNVANVFTFKIGGHTIGVAESVVVTWVCMAIIVIAAILLTRNLKVEHPGKTQLVFESLMGWIHDFLGDILGERGAIYIPYLTTVMLYLAVGNLIGMAGFKPPTKDLNVTVALALMSIVLVEYANIRDRGVKGFFHSFAEPMSIMTPINILEVVTRPLSLCMRLFGNVLGSFVIMELLKYICNLLFPLPFSLYFDVFDGLLQAYVFVLLTSLYIKGSLKEG